MKGDVCEMLYKMPIKIETLSIFAFGWIHNLCMNANANANENMCARLMILLSDVDSSSYALFLLFPLTSAMSSFLQHAGTLLKFI